MELVNYLLYFVAFLLVLKVLCAVSPQFQYYAKFIFFTLAIMTVTGSLIPVYLLRGRSIRNSNVSAAVIRPIVSFFLGLQHELQGRENIKRETSYVLVSNHQSCIDVVGMFAMLPYIEKCTAVAKRILLYILPFGPSAWLSGLTFINRKKSQSAQQVLNELGEIIKKDKIKLWIFPEGTRNSSGTMLPFKKGAFHVAISAQLPILPIVFSSYYFIDHEKLRFDPGKIIVKALPPVPTTGLTKEDVDTLIEKVRQIMIDTNKEISEELNKLKHD